MYAALFIASAAMAAAVAVPQAEDAASFAGQSAPHNSAGPAIYNPSYPNATTDAAEAISQYCFKVTADNNNWKYELTGVWGSKSGTIGSTGGQICVPTNNNAGGALWVGTNSLAPGASSPNMGPGNTKFECFLPSSGTGNCDVSLVDGYSLSMSCSVSGVSHPIGGPVNLYKGSNACPDKSKSAQGICLNDVGAHATSQGQVPAFFQPAVNNGNYYCIWDDCNQDYYFSVTNQVSCHISGTPP